MKRKILLATGNKGKLLEMKLALTHSDLEFLSLQEVEAILGQSAPVVIEDGQSYLENCLIKARAYQEWSGFPVIADDTGLEVDALNGAPGIYSARYAGENASSTERNLKLLKEVGVTKDRQARFICELIFLIAANEYVSARGELQGYISEELYGQGGFGYDSVFCVADTGKTLAQIKESDPGFKTHRKVGLAILNNTDLFQRFIKGN